jgi:hypothetical protein
MIRKEDGYINATQLCKVGGKEFKKWHRNDKTKELVEKVYTKTQIDKDILIQINRSGLNEERCTWVHPTIGLHIAQWISTDFFLQTVDWINEWKIDNENNEKYKKAIETIKPDGETKKIEKMIQLYYKNQTGGEIEVETPFGYIDLLTSTKIIEIKNALQWKHALGQILSYSNFFPSHKKWIYLFDMKDSLCEPIEMLLKKFDVHLFIVNTEMCVV